MSLERCITVSIYGMIEFPPNGWHRRTHADKVQYTENQNQSLALLGKNTGEGPLKVSTVLHAYKGTYW